MNGPEALGKRFPPGFLWGAGTSAYQIEGAVDEDGRGESIWDRFARAGRTKGGHTGDVACDYYHRWADDLDLMASVGLRAFRFSIAWPRILAEGDGPVNRPGLDFYRRVAEGLLERGIAPMATIYHWDLPIALQERGGWAARDTAQVFADYAQVVVGALGDLVPLWVTQNEPWVQAFLGHGFGVHAPGLRDWPTAFAVAHHLLLGHGLAVQAIRAAAPPGAEVGIAVDLYPMLSVSDSSGDIAAARRMDGWRNRWILDPLLTGAYPADVAEELDRWLGPPRWLRDGDLGVIATPTDFLGVNFYSRHRVRAGGPEDVLGIELAPPQAPLTSMGWEIAPDGLEEVLMRLHSHYGAIPLYVTENGAAYDEVPQDGTVPDPERVEYLSSHVAALARAREAGVDVRGYFVWSFLDNFEWQEGYTKRFGLVHVDFRTQRRTPKDSALWYRRVIKASMGRTVAQS